VALGAVTTQDEATLAGLTGAALLKVSSGVTLYVSSGVPFLVTRNS
jgi:hypothetical protein